MTFLTQSLSKMTLAPLATTATCAKLAAPSSSRLFHSTSTSSSSISTSSLEESSSHPPTIRWGIVSAGKISSDFTKALTFTEGAEAAAVAARSHESSQKFAVEHNIPQSYGNYQDLFSDPTIDVVYIGSIADQHYKLAQQSILAGKPTVVEKPICLTTKDAYDLMNLARSKNVFLMEGMWTRCFPAMKHIEQLIQSEEIGRIISIQGDFGWCTKDCDYPQDRIWNRESGGMILDIGMYMTHLGQVAFGSSKAPETIQAMGVTKHGVDHTVLGNIMYNNDNSDTQNDTQKGFLQFYVTGDANTEERVVIQGTEGRIIIDPPAHVPSRISISKDLGRGENDVQVLNFDLPDDSYTTWNYPGSIGFTYQIQDVNDALHKGYKECPSYTHQDSLQVCTILDEILHQVHGSHNESVEEQVAKESLN